MKNILRIGIFVIWVAGFTIILSPFRMTYVKVHADDKVDTVSHAKSIYISSLEWCESRGKYTAINPNDRDNTPSYYSFQWKPGTFKWLGEKYGLIDKGLSDKQVMKVMKDYDIQRKIVERMITDKDIKMKGQFPDCVRKLGLPPLY